MTRATLMGPPLTTIHANASRFDAYEAVRCSFVAWSPHLSVLEQEHANGSPKRTKA
jgi:hypothetical protein